MAVATGVADVVVVYRAFNERSGRAVRRRVPPPAKTMATTENEYRSWVNPYGLLTPAQQTAMFARRYMHVYGATSEDFGRVAVPTAAHAAINPTAWFYGKPITLDDHQASRWIAEPLHLLDCCQETDGGQAMVIVSAERARDLPHQPAVITAAAQGIGPDQYTMVSYYRDDLTRHPGDGARAPGSCGPSPGSARGHGRRDPLRPLHPVRAHQLEEYGFCGRGEAKDFIADGNFEVGGALPTNTHGGQIGEGYLHGTNGIAEGVRLIRGTSTNQPGTSRTCS